MINFVITALVIDVAFAGITPRNDFKAIEWTGGNFKWPSQSTEFMYRNTGNYIRKNVIATRGVIHRDDVFVACPRLKSGVPSTLARLTLKNNEPLLEPYPSWSLQEKGNCKALQNVVDVFLDSKNILWVLDTGVVNSLEDPTLLCPPKVMAINPKTGKIVKTVELSNFSTPTSRLQYVIADYSWDDRVFIYVTDAAKRAIIVYDVSAGRGYCAKLPKIVTNGAKKRDVLYCTLLRPSDGTTYLIFTYLGAKKIFSIRTDILHSGTLSGHIHDLGVKPKKMIILGTDNGSAIFFRYEGKSDVYRWDAMNIFSEENFQKVMTGNDYLLATQIMPDNKRSRMRILESNFNDFIHGTVGCGTNHAISVL